MRKRILFNTLLIGASIVILGLGSDPVQAKPFDINEYQYDENANNGNHNGWYKESGQTGQYAQNGNNGNHNGWYKESGQTVISTQNATSVPEPTTLMLLGAGLVGIGIARRLRSKG